MNHPWLGMVKIPTIYGDDWGMVYYCYTHINEIAFRTILLVMMILIGRYEYRVAVIFMELPAVHWKPWFEQKSIIHQIKWHLYIYN